MRKTEKMKKRLLRITTKIHLGRKISNMGMALDLTWNSLRTTSRRGAILGVDLGLCAGAFHSWILLHKQEIGLLLSTWRKLDFFSCKGLGYITQ